MLLGLKVVPLLSSLITV
ncbi:hypothetical protein [Faecalibacterium prausnitzii]|nr:hypothetical protein [Faecalibacterium prausnitzii]